MPETIKDILIRRDGMTEEEALDLIQRAKLDLEEGILNGEPGLISKQLTAFQASFREFQCGGCF